MHRPILAVTLARTVLLGLAAGYVVVAATLRPPYPYADLVPLAPWAYEIGFLLCAALAVLTAVRPTSRLTLWGLLWLTFATGSRAIVLWAIGGATPPAVGWAMYTLLQLYAWPYLRADAAGPTRR